MIRVLHITTHAIQYQVPLFRKLTERNRFQLTVAFTEGRRDSGYFDSEFGAPVKWNLDLVSGYRGIEAGPGRFRAT